MYIYIYIYTYICMSVYMYIYHCIVWEFSLFFLLLLSVFSRDSHSRRLVLEYVLMFLLCFQNNLRGGRKMRPFATSIQRHDRMLS